MIDTIVLLLTREQFTITDPSLFKPNASLLLSSKAHSIQAKQGPSTRELAKGIYKPRLTLMENFKKGKAELVLKIELSLPKLFFGNNFQELRYKDFEPLAAKLLEALATMGVQCSQKTIYQAPVSGIHYSKNIPLTDGSTPYHYIKRLKEANISLARDINQTDYRNGGHSYKWHCNSYEIVFYDKIKDLEKARQSAKRSLEKDSELQLHLFDSFQQRKLYEILRMEVRLNKRQKMKALFTKLGIKSDLTFKKLFKPALSKKVLLHYLEELEEKRPALLDYPSHNAKALLSSLILNNPHVKPKQILLLFGLRHALDSLAPRELRTLFGSMNDKAWQRLMDEAKGIGGNSNDSVLGIIKDYIEQFMALTKIN